MQVLFGMALRQIEPCCATGSSNHGEAASSRACCGRPGLGRAGLQHAVAAPENLEGQHPLAVQTAHCTCWPTAPGSRSRVKASGLRRVSKQPGGLFARRRRKHGGTKRRIWRKIHIGIDEKSLEIRAAKFTTSDMGDAPMLPELLDQIPPDQEIASVTADGAFDTRKCHDAIAARGAAAIIPPRKNAKPWTPDTAGAIARNDILRPSRRVGRTIWRRWSGYHRRSRAETKMHCVKLLRPRLSARDFDRQVAEFQLRVAVRNGFTGLGIPVTEAVGRGCLGKGLLQPSADLGNRVLLCVSSAHEDLATPGRLERPT